MSDTEDVSFNKTDSIEIQKQNRPKTNVEDLEDLDEDTICGLWFFHPQWLQRFATARTFIILYSLTGVLQGTTFAYMIAVLSTLEKRYAFNTKISGILMTLDEVFPIVLGTFIGYFSGRAHRPRLVAVGMCMSVLCCFVAAFPYFLYGPADNFMASATTSNSSSVVCNTERRNDEQCAQGQRPPTAVAVACLMFGNFLKGFGNIAYYTAGASYIDDGAKRKNTPLYFAFSMATRNFGPIFGYFLASIFLNYYENPAVDPGFDSEDPRWIGAWWLGYVVQGIILSFLTIPLIFFPRRLPRQRKRSPSTLAKIERQSFKETVVGYLKAMRRLLSSPIFIFFNLGSILNPIFVFNMMLPKYIETQFHISGSEASIWSGPPAIMAGQIATLFGGYIIFKFRPTARQIVGGMACFQCLLAVGFMILMIPSCKSRFDMKSLLDDGANLINECNDVCNCTTNVMAPVCGPDSTTSYFSPCHAGCSVSVFKDNIQTFQNCSCLHNTSNEFEFFLNVENGFCLDEDCSQMLLAFVIVFVLTCFCVNSFTAAHQLLLLRCVEPEDKSIALGAFETAVSLLSFIPLPIMFGALVDSACLIWESSCGQTGNCWYYDLDKYSKLLLGTSAVLAVCSGVSWGILCYLAPGFQPMYEDEDVIKYKKDQNAIESFSSKANL